MGFFPSSIGVSGGILISLVSIGGGLSIHPAVYGQLIPDNTLGLEASEVMSDGLVGNFSADIIQGGAQRAQNLFHSFSEFNIEAGQSVYFANPSGVENIISRITGRNISAINGLLGVDGLANLYLLNPNGILFGPEASLDIAGSFFATTADSLSFADGYEYSSHSSEQSALLTISIPLGLQSGQIPAQGTIQNSGRLSLGTNQSLTFSGHAIVNTGEIQVPAGRISLIADRVTMTGDASLNVSGNEGGGTLLIGGDFQGRGVIPTASRVWIGPNVTLLADALQQGDGGLIVVWADQVAQFAGRASAQGGLQFGDGGLVEISAVKDLRYNGQVDTRAPNGELGILLLDPTNIEIVDIGEDTLDLDDVDDFSDPDLGPGVTRIAAIALSIAEANIRLQASQDITFNADVTLLFPGVGLTAEAGNDIILNRSVQATGGGELSFIAGNNITFTGANAFAWTYGEDAALRAGNTITLLDGAQVDTAPFFGDSGNLTVTGQRLVMTGGSRLISGSFSDGASGSLAVNAADIEISGIGSDFSGNFGSTGLVANSRDAFGTGSTGRIAVNAARIQVLAGGAIAAASLNDQAAGLIVIDSSESIQVSGFAPSDQGPFRSGIFASSSAGGDAGNIVLRTPNLTVEGGAQVAVSSTGLFGQSGNLEIQSAQVDIAGGPFADQPGGLFARALGFGRAGRVSITEANRITLREGAVLDTTSAFSTGGSIRLETADLELREGSRILNTNVLGSASGPVSITARGNFSLTGGSSILGDNFSDGSGSNITVQAGRLRVADGSFMSTSSFGTGQSGAITITATEAVDVINGGFISTATFVGTGRGGDLLIRSPIITVDGGQLEANSFGAGAAGTIELAANSLIIQNQGEVSVSGVLATSQTGNLVVFADYVLLADGGKLSAVAPSSNGGNIDLTATQNLVLRRGSLISAEAGTAEASQLIAPTAGLGNGGNIAIRSPFVIAVREEDSDISANALIGDGGQVFIEARGIFGLEFRPGRTPLSDITASSEFGTSGLVILDVLDTDFIQNTLTELSQAPVDTDTLVAGSCIAYSGEAEDSSFIVTGAGGLPDAPGRESTALFPTGTVRGTVDLATTPVEEPIWQPGTAIVEPTGVYQMSDGRLVLARGCP